MDKSEQRRFLQFGLSDYYTNNFTPFDEFGKWFFGEEWNDDDWTDYYYFMFSCAFDYLDYIKDKKIITNIVRSEVIEKKVLINEVGEDLVSFLETFENDISTEKGIVYEKKYSKKELFEKYVLESGDKKISQRNFTHRLRKFKKLNKKYLPDKQDTNGNWQQESRSGGNDFIIFLKNNINKTL